jgi:hypothetical protein
MAMRAGREGGLDGGGGATAIRGLALLDPHFWGKRPLPCETRDSDTRQGRAQDLRFGYLKFSKRNFWSSLKFKLEHIIIHHDLKLFDTER